MKDRISTIQLIILLVSLSACTGSFEKYNTDQTGFPDEIQIQDYNKYGIPANIAQKGIYYNYNWGDGSNWQFQIMQNLCADMFCGYFHDYLGKFNSSNSVYNLNATWTSSNWETTYGYIMPSLFKSEQLNNDDNFLDFLAITKILKVATMHRIADQYGPLIYSKFGSKGGSDPESLQDAYTHFFADLEEAINLLEEWIIENPDRTSFTRFDIITKTKTYDEWLRFANSLRLRLAMRISNVDKQTASEQVNKCFESGVGFLEEEKHIIAVSTVETGYSNPLGQINKGWNEVYMNASMESFLVGYDDPRLPKYFEKAAGGKENIYKFDISNSYKGFRQGTGVTHDNYNNHSKSTITPSTDAILMTPAEVWFLRAEAALRGFTSDNPETCYNNGINASFSQWGLYGVTSNYLENNRAPADYRDALDSKFDVPAMTTITPRWNEEATNEEKLERIITQKWIACYPEGAEAWAEQRRTGYPRLFKVYENNSNGAINTDVMIRRLPYPANLNTESPDQYRLLMEYLQGADMGGTRLWWDVGYNTI